MIDQKGSPRTPSVRRILLAFALALSIVVPARPANGQEHRAWRSATPAELKSFIPARAPVEKERIETELRSASGITDGREKYVAGVVLITAGYSAEGKYSHFFVAQVPVRINSITLLPGEYVIGWKHKDDGLIVTFYDAASGKPQATVEASRSTAITRVESFRIWPPADRSVIQIGRFTFPYSLP